jgi:hypothetical protein
MNWEVCVMYLVVQVVRFWLRFEPRISRIQSTSATSAAVIFYSICYVPLNITW